MSRPRRGPLRARHQGSTCCVCGQEIRTGALIARREAAWAHQGCAEGSEVPVAPAVETSDAQRASTDRQGRSTGHSR